MKKIFKQLLGTLALAGLISGTAVFAAGCNPETENNPPEDITKPKPDDPQAPVLDTVNVRLSDATKTQEYKPANDFKEGYYVFRCIDNAFTLTDGENEQTATFNVSGYNSVIVYYTNNTVYDIGTTDLLEFNIYFSKLDTNGTADSPHKIESQTAVVLNLDAKNLVYLHNPEETSIVGERGGHPLQVSGENYSATVGTSTSTSRPFLVAGGKDIKVERAANTEGAVILYFNSISNRVSVNVGETANLQIELLERTITSSSGTTTSLLWSTDSARFTFTAENAGQYKITVTSDFNSDKMAITNIVSTSSIVPEKISSNVSDNNDDNSDDFNTDVAMANPYTATYNITEANIDASKGRSNTFNVEFSSGGDFSSLTEGYKITYTILVEYIAE